jgi:hypothetical protein
LDTHAIPTLQTFNEAPMSKALKRVTTQVQAQGAQARSDAMAAELAAKKKPNATGGAPAPRQRRSTLLK